MDCILWWRKQPREGGAATALSRWLGVPSSSKGQSQQWNNALITLNHASSSSKNPRWSRLRASRHDSTPDEVTHRPWSTGREGQLIPLFRQRVKQCYLTQLFHAKIDGSLTVYLHTHCKCRNFMQKTHHSWYTADWLFCTYAGYSEFWLMLGLATKELGSPLYDIYWHYSAACKIWKIM